GLAHGVADVRESLTPRNLLESFLPRSRRRAASSGLLLQMLNLTRSYPMVLSLGSAVLSTVARRRMRLWKLAGGAALAWLLARNRRDGTQLGLQSPSSPHMASTRARTASSMRMGRPHSRSVSPGHLLVASMPILPPRPETGEAKSR